MITMYRVFLVLMAAAAGLMMPEAMGLPKDSQYTIGPGFLPAIMLGLTIASCLILLVFDLKQKNTASVEKSAIPRLALYILATVLLIIGMEHVGIIVSVVIYIFCVSFFVERHSALSSAEVALIVGTFIYLIFHVWLKVPMSICNFF